MHTLKAILFTCALALSCGLMAQTYAAGQVIEHLEVAPGKGQAVLDWLKTIKETYSANPEVLKQPMAVYQYDDSSVDIIFEVNDMAGSDRLDAVLDHAMMSLPTEKRNDLWNIDHVGSIITSWQDEVKECIEWLSFEPADPGFEGSAPYVEVITYRHRMGDQEKISALAAESVAFSQKNNMQQQYQFVVNKFGGEANTFQIVNQAKSAEDLARRKAADSKVAMAEQKAWWAKVEPLVEKVSVRTGRYLPELSIEVEEKPYKFFFVAKDQFPAEKTAELTDVYGKLIKALRDAGADFYWNTDYMEDGALYQSTPIEHMSDLDVMMEDVNKRAYQLKAEDRQTLGAAFYALPSTRSMWVVEYHSDLSYLDPVARNPEQFTHFAQIEYTFAPEDRASVMEIAKEGVELYRNAKATQPFQVYSYAFGGADNVLVARFFGTSVEDTRVRSEQTIKAIGGAYEPFMKRFDKIMTASKPVMGRQAPELSYQPQTAKR
ncbi:hypothetical protein FUA23_10860 [Neolewinella aurantiaca]|uniref:Uncharacterized protein n=1 Tax=Neolewinella aurantiaca TaxID=2602767 RepID=A0A5C7FF86_9BACT|nr:hypothetical protein [Neolewinella aurantiaca]TXF89458.1 hypothetical protein FUA23_10860 [Neolewinella aurantiaca]